MKNEKPESYANDFNQILPDYSVKIKDVYIEIPDFKFFHSPVPHSQEQEYERFLGRNKILNQIKAVLSDSKTRSGTYLVTGFRGMGKTSVVRKAINDLNTDFTINKDKQSNNFFSRLIDQVRVLFFKAYSASGKMTDFIFVIITSIFVFPFLFELSFNKKLFWPWKAWGSNFFQNNFFPDNTDELFFFSIRISLLLFLFFLSVSVISLILDSLFFILRFIAKQISPELWEKNRIKSFEINLSQDEIKDVDVLRQITNHLYEYWINDVWCISQRFDRKIHFVTKPFIWLISKPVPLYNTSYYGIKNRLIRLNNRIFASFKEENLSNSYSIKTTTGFFEAFFGGSKKNELNYPIASSKEIETELIQILKDIEIIRKKVNESIVTITIPENIPDFVFVIDELDKIDPNINYNISDSALNSEAGFNNSVTDRIRQRQEAVAKLLANLKGFLNVASAKFIFIGGREMYDASLADIADRDSFYSSIFHDVIYVNSFFKDKLELRSGITRMTEAYLCQLIIPKEYFDKRNKQSKDKGQNEVFVSNEDKYSLKTFFEYLIDLMLKPDQHEGYKIKNSADQISKQKIFKIIFLLQNYILYLTFRSNGSPKKLISLIEDIISIEELNDRVKSDSVVVRGKEKKENKKVFFLKFTFNKQYEINLTSNLYRPYFIINSRNQKLLGDKILFSTAFIIDHILKFHPFGFAWRNLELLPEVILVNREPSLRQYIEEIMWYLQQLHIRPTRGGIFQYKFYNKISNELKLLSKISELSSAAFNFTLDESIHIKRHFRRKLEDLQKTYLIQSENYFNHSISFIQTILGDLHFYDKEYDDALVYYGHSIQALRSKEALERMTKHQFIIWVRNKLKIGLTLEKMKIYNSAYSYYRKLTLEIPRILSRVVKEYLDSPENKLNPAFLGEKPYRNLQILIEPYIAILSVLEKQRLDGISVTNIEKNEKEVDFLFEFEKKREKEENFQNEFNIQSQEKFHNKHRVHYIKAEYYYKTASLLFFKNKPFEELLTKEEFAELQNVSIIQNLLERVPDYRPSLAAYVYYKKALKYLVYPYFGDYGLQSDENVFIKTVELLGKKMSKSVSSLRKYFIANVLGKLADSLLASVSIDEIIPMEKNKMIDKILKSDRNSDEFIKNYKDVIVKIKNGKKDDCWALDIHFILLLFGLSSIYYLKSGYTYSYAFQYKKILFLLKDYITLSKFKSEITPNQKQKNMLKVEWIDLLETIAIKIIKSITWSTDVANRPQILKYRDVLHLEIHDELDRKIIYNNISTSNEVREVVILVEEIKLKLRKIGLTAPEGPLLNNSFLSPYNQVSSKYLRAFELNYRSQLYYYVIFDNLNLRELFEFRIDREEREAQLRLAQKIKDTIKSIDSMDKCRFIFVQNNSEANKEFGNEVIGENNGKNLVSFLIKEAIFCLIEIINSHKLFGVSYITNYSYIAHAHMKLGYWCRAFENLVFIYNNLAEDKDVEFILHLKEEIISFLGSDTTYYLEPNYHFELAIQHFYYSIQMHSEGKTYKNIVQNCYYLEDDFSDNLTHFSASLEKLRMNTGLIRAKIDELSKLIDEKNGSMLYDLKSYF